MRSLLVVLFALCSLYAKERVITEKKITADTTITIDTIYTVTYDTVVINKTVRDTTLILKTDTVKTAKAPAKKK